MILILTASIMYWSLKQPGGEIELESILNQETKTPNVSPELEGTGEAGLAADMSNLTTEDTALDTTLSPHRGTEEPTPGDEKDEKADGEWPKLTIFLSFIVILFPYQEN